MVSKHLSVRINDELLQDLEEECRKSGQSRSAVAKRFLEEGLRMERHPRIVFRPGPAGRRPALVDGPDVWVLGRLFRERESPQEHLAESIADEMALRPDQVEAAARYYDEFREEIDAWLDRLDAEADRAEAEWRRERGLPSR